VTGPLLGALVSPPADAYRSVDVVVVGAGVAGMVAALQAAAHGRQVLLLTKTRIGDGSSRWAQGGIAAAVDPDDNPSDHAADTLAAGGEICDPLVVGELTRAAPEVVRALESWGMVLDRHHGALSLAREGGHGRARVVHAGGDATGARLVETLVRAVRLSPIETGEHAVALDLLTTTGRVRGVRYGELDPADGRLRRVIEVEAPWVLLATGGMGQMFATTTNPPEATGDGVALAARAGAVLSNLEFVQFHPTVLAAGPVAGQRSLLTEALRGAGARLVDGAGRAVMAGVHPLGDLAPRDVVAATMARQMAACAEPHLWLDLRPVEELHERFPTVVAACRTAGFDPEWDLLPVRPAAHYACGGVASDLSGHTSLGGLLALGEVAATGVHGANRLASNSLLEAVESGRRAAALVTADPMASAVSPPSLAGMVTADGAERGDSPAGGRSQPSVAQGPMAQGPMVQGPMVQGPIVRGCGWVDAATRWPTAEAASARAGVLRSGPELSALIGYLEAVAVTSGPARDLATIEATNLHTVTRLLAIAALARQESRGCHQRLDFPARDPRWRGPSQVWAAPDGHVAVRFAVTSTQRKAVA
jgi:L-aspartate oxidase